LALGKGGSYEDFEEEESEKFDDFALGVRKKWRSFFLISNLIFFLNF